MTPIEILAFYDSLFGNEASDNAKNLVRALIQKGHGELVMSVFEDTRRELANTSPLTDKEVQDIRYTSRFNKIEAIKNLRESRKKTFGVACGLKEAKDMVEDVMAAYANERA